MKINELTEAGFWSGVAKGLTKAVGGENGALDNFKQGRDLKKMQINPATGKPFNADEITQTQQDARSTLQAMVIPKGKRRATWFQDPATKQKKIFYKYPDQQWYAKIVSQSGKPTLQKITDAATIAKLDKMAESNGREENIPKNGDPANAKADMTGQEQQRAADLDPETMRQHLQGILKANNLPDITGLSSEQRAELRKALSQ